MSLALAESVGTSAENDVVVDDNDGSGDVVLSSVLIVFRRTSILASERVWRDWKSVFERPQRLPRSIWSPIVLQTLSSKSSIYES